MVKREMISSPVNAAKYKKKLSPFDDPLVLIELPMNTSSRRVLQFDSGSLTDSRLIIITFVFRLGEYP